MYYWKTPDAACDFADLVRSAMHYKKTATSAIFVHKIPPSRMRNVLKAAITN